MSYIPESNQESDTLQPKNQIKADFKVLFKGIYFFLKELLDIKADTDAENTKASIRADIAFKGHTSWILICSIFIASIFFIELSLINLSKVIIFTLVATVLL